MNENVNLCKLLKGHEGENFYSPLYGAVKFSKIVTYAAYPIEVIDNCNICHTFDESGRFVSNYKDSECVLFPSKDQRDWNKWAEQQKPKTPKIWNEIEHCNVEVWQVISNMDFGPTKPIVKSALALLKIHQLIEVGYGGNITNEEWKNENMIKYVINRDIYDINPCCKITTHLYSHIAFHTEQQKDKFLSYPENIQLIKDFYQIP